MNGIRRNYCTIGQQPCTRNTSSRKYKHDWNYFITQTRTKRCTQVYLVFFLWCRHNSDVCNWPNTICSNGMAAVQLIIITNQLSNNYYHQLANLSVITNLSECICILGIVMRYAVLWNGSEVRVLTMNKYMLYLRQRKGNFSNGVTFFLHYFRYFNPQGHKKKL